jgi:hypothetical protein
MKELGNADTIMPSTHSGPPIIAHGLGDTIDMILIFLGKFPGM